MRARGMWPLIVSSTLLLASMLGRAWASDGRGSDRETWAGCSSATEQEKAEFRSRAYECGVPLSAASFLMPERQLRMVLCGPVPGMPLSAFERVVLGVRGDTTVVEGPEDLVGHVRTASPEAALDYVRLFTSPATAHCMREPTWLEVVPLSAVDRQFVFGRDEYLRPGNYWAVDLFRQFGVLKESEWREEGLSDPVVLKVIEGFVVVRVLFRPDEEGPDEWRTRTAHWVAEMVSTDGRVERRVLGDVRLGKVGVQRDPDK